MGAGIVPSRRLKFVRSADGCSSWVPGEHKTEQWLALNAARAIENSVYVAGVCQAPPISVGRSVLVDPNGGC
ncbi:MULTISPECIES: nitrilase-related carbon-nitrogen hydrolase [unclassified Arthrobacter]|uniref:nitrilase-related carbon-nitrogen hydrolase n=1 Tax=unclassified Arthrobacter TaxID=235627 RepID=UPI00339ACB5C